MSDAKQQYYWFVTVGYLCTAKAINVDG